MPFGEVLQTRRKRRNLSQLVLADSLGVHRNTIGAWERGTWLPGTRGIVADLAKRLGLDDKETEQLMEAALFYTGRDSIAITGHKTPCGDIEASVEINGTLYQGILYPRETI